jgi:homoserine kinase type II
MLFRHQRVVAVVDYDSARRSQRVVDVANGTLQFSMRAVRDIERWPAEVDESRARHFLEGYKNQAPLDDDEWVCLPHLMVEALIAESVFPIAATGSFGHYQGFRFMKMVRRKVNWLRDNAERVSSLLAGEG